MSYKTICTQLNLTDIKDIFDTNILGVINLKDRIISEAVPNHLDYMLVYVTEYEILYGTLYKSKLRTKFPIPKKTVSNELEFRENGVMFSVNKVIPLKNTYYNSGVELQINDSNVKYLRYPTYEDKLVYVSNFLV